MCLAIPTQVEAIHDDGTATVTLGGIKKAVSLALLDGVAPGDYVIVHTGFAISRLDADEAERTLELLRQVGEVGGGP